MATPETKLRTIAKKIDGTFSPDYSGRGMYGNTCMGIVCSDSMRCIELAVKSGFKGAKMDNMGHDTIVYWPNVPGISLRNEVTE